MSQKMTNTVTTDFLKFNHETDIWKEREFLDSLSKEERKKIVEKMSKEIEEFFENKELLFPLIAELFVNNTRVREYSYTENRKISIDEDILFIKVLNVIRQLDAHITSVFFKGVIFENSNEDKYLYKGETEYSKKHLRTCQMYKSIIDFFSDRISYCNHILRFLWIIPILSDDVENDVSDGGIWDVDMNFTLDFIEYLKENEEKYGLIICSCSYSLSHDENKKLNYYDLPIMENGYIARRIVDQNDNKFIYALFYKNDEGTQEEVYSEKEGKFAEFCKKIIYYEYSFQEEIPTSLLMNNSDFIIRTHLIKCVRESHHIMFINAQLDIKEHKTKQIKRIPVRALYCPICKKFYIQEYIYESILTMGTPCCRVLRSSQAKAEMGITSNEWNEESLLHEAGYTVNKNDNLSSEERRKILDDLIESGEISPYAIIDHLGWLISRSKNYRKRDMTEAQNKWKSDADYIYDKYFSSLPNDHYKILIKGLYQ